MSNGDLPSGTVTFVFSDIEGSTRLLKRLGERYPDVLERHRTLLRQGWATFGGQEVNTEGDGCFVAFDDATNAVRACAAGQRLLGAERWPDGNEVRVRMGVHSGLAAPHNRDYMALAVHQAARVISAAHGGQVLVSGETAARVEFGDDLSLTSVGRFRLRDFDEPVSLFQLAGPGLSRQFPPVRALPDQGHNLVRPPNAFFGRDSEAALVRSLLGPGRIVTLAGPGGVGKTRLATEIGVRVAGSWADGVWAIDLANADDATLVADTVGDAIGVHVGGANRWADVLDHLRSQRALLFLDNAETQIEQCARLVSELLRECGGVGVLLTSREPLRIAGEQIVQIEPLPVPGADATPEEAVLSPSVRLFLDRARALRPAFGLDPAIFPTIARICRRLDGLPLAIEIVAARTPVLDPSAILAGLDNMRRLLRTSDRSLPKRQRSLDGLLDWSYRLLSVEEQAALRRLAIFGAGFSVEAATVAVADDYLATDDVPELIWSLVDRSLMGTDFTANGTRYRFLETVRQYARRLLDEASETGPVAERLAAWFLDRLGPWRFGDRIWIGDVSIDLENLRSLVPIVARQDSATAQQLVCSIGLYRDVSQAYRAGIDELTRFAAELPAETPSRVALLSTLAYLHLRVGDIASARVVLAAADGLRRRVGDPPWDDVGFERTSGELAVRTLDPGTAAAIAEGALNRELSPRGRARMWNLLGLAKSAAGELPAAFAAFTEQRAEEKAAGNEAYLAGAEGNLAEIALRLGDASAAAHHQHACLQLAIALGQPVMLAYSLIVAARLAAAGGDWATASRLHAKASAMLEETGWSLYDDDLRATEQLRADARIQLGAGAFAAAVSTGAAMETPAAAALADEVLLGVARSQPV